MKKIIIGFLLLLAIIAGVFVFSVVRSFDVELYKERVVTRLEALTGRKIQLQDASLSWGSTPIFIMNNLVISNQDGGSTPNMISVKQIQAEMDWKGIFSGDLEIKKVVFQEPSVLVERSHTFQTNFSFPLLFNPRKITDQDFYSSDVNDIKIDLFEIVGGKITYHNSLTSKTVVLEGVNGMGKVDSLLGPFSFKGDLEIEKIKFSVNIETEKIVLSNPLRIKTSLKEQSKLLEMDLNAELSVDSVEDWLTVDGTFNLFKPDEFFKRFMKIDWQDSTSLIGSLKFVVNSKDLNLKEIVLTQEKDNPVSYIYNLKKDENGKEKMILTIDELDCTFCKNFGDLKTKLIQFQTERDFDITIKKLRYNQQELTDFIFQGSISPNAFDGTLNVNLPFGGKLDSHIKKNDNIWTIDMNSEMKEFHSLVKWFGGDQVIEKIPKSLTDLRLMMKIKISDGGVDIEALNINDIQVSGRLEKSKDSFKSDLKVHNLNFDQFYPQSQELTQTGMLDLIKTSIAKISNITENISIKSSFLNAVFFGQTYQELGIVAQKQGMDWSVEKISIQKEENKNLTISGKVKLEQDGKYLFENLRLDLASPWALSLLKLIQSDFFASEIENITVSEGYLIYSGDTKQGQFELDVKFDGTDLKARGFVNLDNKGFENIQLNISNENFLNIAKMVLSDYELSDEWEIPFVLDGKISWNNNEKIWTDMTVSLDENNFKTSGIWKDERFQINVFSDKFDFELFLPDFQTIFSFSPTPFNIFENIPNGDLKFEVDNFSYGDIEGGNLKLEAILQDKLMSISDFSCLIGREHPGRVSAKGTVSFEKNIGIDLNLDWDNLFSEQNSYFTYGNGKYHFGNGLFSGKLNLKTSGDSWFALFDSSSGEGEINWKNGDFYGLDVSVWLSAVQAASVAQELGKGFSSRLQYALSGGKTAFPDLRGNFTLEKGTVRFMDVQGKNDLISISGMTMDLFPNKVTNNIKIPIALTDLSKLPPIIFEFKNGTYNVNSTLFEQAFTEELKLKNQKNIEAKELKNLQARELKNQQMRQEAQNIIKQMETTLKQLQERVALRDETISSERLDELNLTAREIRELAVKTDLMPSEYASLLEKTKLWAIQVNDLNNAYARQDLLSQKAKVNQLSPLVNNYLAAMEQFWQQHPQSVILYEIVMNARQVAETIKLDESQLSVAQDASTVQNLILRIQNNFAKIEKAHQYAQKIHLSLMNGGSV